jgi:HlyD family secretion protein
MQRPKRGLLVLFSLIVLVVAFVVWRWANPTRERVEVAVVERGPVERTATNSRAGTVRVRRRAKLSPELGGVVIAIPHPAGSSVRAGDIVLELDATLESGEVTLREREVEAARAEAERFCLAAQRAERKLERNRNLPAELLPDDALDDFESGSREAAAGCAAATAASGGARAALDLARRQLAKRTLRAPFDGVVAEVSIEVGEWTTPSPPALPVPPVLDILDPTSVYVELPMDEVDAGRLTPGLPARLTVDSHAGESFAGHVVRVAPYVLDIEAQNRTVEIEIEFDEPPPVLLAGTSADVEVIIDARDDVLRVPAAAVLSGDRVLVVEGEFLAERSIQTGLRNWNFVEVVTGLAAGDRVVTSLDRPEISAGARVEVAASGAAAP